ncbi:hypothetical protein Syun_009282 [Stephania yunnanensis]|uniref:Uncharacterized protein n=1 Tax=Stephania yunnanensis TaxID=152371 RepID=A0AAP0KE84_9MAGN
MACMKLGSKVDAFQKKGQAWFCTTGLPSDIVIEVRDMSFHLHKFAKKMLGRDSSQSYMQGRIRAQRDPQPRIWGRQPNCTSELFLNQVVLRSWNDSIKALRTCEDVLPQ